MKTFKQLINEISLGPKSGKEWTSFINAMFGSESEPRSKEFEKMLKKKIKQKEQERKKEKDRRDEEEDKWDYLSGPEDFRI